METNYDDELKKLYEQLQDAIKNSDGVEDADLENLINISYDDLEEEILKQQNTQKIKFKKLHDDVISPKYAYELDSGFDLYSTEKIVLPAFGRALVPTGLSLDLPEGYEIQVRTKSGLAVNLGLMVLNSPGTVDRGYLGEIKVPVFNTNNSSLIIEKGMKVAQAVLCPVVCGKFVEFEELDDLGTSERGDKGFGSTGIK
jgi:dUTP pyrophosphatase